MTGQTLAKYGVIDIWNRWLSTATLYGNQAYAWMNKTFPGYWGHVDRVIGPYIKIVRQKAFIAWTFIWDSLLPVREWVNQVLPPIFNRIQKEFLPVVFAFFKSFYEAVRAVAIEFGIWVQENVLTGSLSTENISKFASESVNRLHSSTQNFVTWISKQAAALTN